MADLLGRGAQKCRKERPSEPDPVSISLIPEVHLVWKGPSHVENEDGRCVHLYLPLIPGWTVKMRASAFFSLSEFNEFLEELCKRPDIHRWELIDHQLHSTLKERMAMLSMSTAAMSRIWRPHEFR